MRRMLQKFSILLVVCLMALPVVAHALGGLVRDAEIELLLRDYSNPLFRAAGLDPSRVGISLINDRNLNAFVQLLH